MPEKFIKNFFTFFCLKWSGGKAVGHLPSFKNWNWKVILFFGIIIINSNGDQYFAFKFIKFHLYFMGFHPYLRHTTRVKKIWHNCGCFRCGVEGLEILPFATLFRAEFMNFLKGFSIQTHFYCWPGFFSFIIMIIVFYFLFIYFFCNFFLAKLWWILILYLALLLMWLLVLLLLVPLAHLFHSIGGLEWGGVE